jgi:hypothetical protein
MVSGKVLAFSSFSLHRSYELQYTVTRTTNSVGDMMRAASLVPPCVAGFIFPEQGALNVC